MTGRSVEPAIEDTSPATRAVYDALCDGDALTQSDVVDRTGLSRAAIRSAIETLEARDAVDVRYDLRDARRKRYELRA